MTAGVSPKPRKASGKVYYFDRGEKIKHYVLPDERAACMYLLGNLALAQVMKRRLIPA